MSTDSKHNFDTLLEQILACQLCKADLPNAPRPIVQLALEASILVIGHAPGIRAHDSATPWNDPSGDRLRKWLELDTDTFYDKSKVALMPMGFCYPGTGAQGDLPPSKPCAPTWHSAVLEHIKPKCIIAIGRYAQQYYADKSLSLTKASELQPARANNIWVMPHPSGRNNIWLKRNPWFESDVLPQIQDAVKQALA